MTAPEIKLIHEIKHNSLELTGFSVDGKIKSLPTLADYVAIESALAEKDAEITKLRAALNEAATWKSIDEMPKDGTWIEGHETHLYRWLPYKKGAPPLQKGIKGRWQKHDGYGFTNCDDMPNEFRIVQQRAIAGGQDETALMEGGK